MTPKELYALIAAEFGGAGSMDPLDLAVYRGAYWVMDLAAYKEVRAACQAAGAVYPPSEQDPEGWVPKPEDRLFGLLVDVREDGGAPHLEYR